MQRNRALAYAAAAVVSVATASGAFAANVGLLGFSDDDRPTGQLQADQIADVGGATSTTLPDIVVTIDQGAVTASSVPGSTVSADDDGTPDQGPGDAPGTTGSDDTFDDHDDDIDDIDDIDDMDDDDHDDDHVDDVDVDDDSSGRGRGGDDDD